MANEVMGRIAAGRTDLVLDHLAAGQPAGSRDADGVSLVEWCAYYGDVTALRVLVERGESLAPLGENLGLHGAAFHGHWRLVEFLLEAGADANAAQAGTGETALHSALCTRNRTAHDRVLQVLLAHGADPNRATTAGVETECFMRDCRTKGESPLHRAAAFGSEETIDLLLEAGAVVDAKDANGETPLGWGSWYGRPDPILRRLCYGRFHIRPGRDSMDGYLQGTPLGGSSTNAPGE